MVPKEVVLADGFRYSYYQCEKCSRVEYDPEQVQRLIDYARAHQYMFVSDWILSWLYVGGDAPVSGITMLQKQMFIVLYEFAQSHDIPSENPGFRAYKFGPYTETIDRNIESLMSIGLVESRGRINSNNERFILTERGKVAGKESLEKLTQEQSAGLERLRRDLQQFDSKGIMTYVYTHYQDYTDKSVVFERTLHRRRK
ncbi:MAG: hypothetical protein FWF07_03880 [Methanomassiliicoccaceae archaeon]|nr:hypothetical protein [Methanomassiliicoccaceae archaeon]